MRSLEQTPFLLKREHCIIISYIYWSAVHIYTSVILLISNFQNLSTCLRGTCNRQFEGIRRHETTFPPFFLKQVCCEVRDNFLRIFQGSLWVKFISEMCAKTESSLYHNNMILAQELLWYRELSLDQDAKLIEATQLVEVNSRICDPHKNSRSYNLHIWLRFALSWWSDWNSNCIILHILPRALWIMLSSVKCWHEKSTCHKIYSSMPASLMVISDEIL